MKKIVIAIICLMMLQSCGKDNEEIVDYSSLYGKWYEVIDETQEGYITSVLTTYWTFRSNKTATHELKLVMNGVEMVSETLNYNYVYDGSYIEFTSLDGIYLRYSVSISGNRMTLGNAEDGYFHLTKK